MPGRQLERPARAGVQRDVQIQRVGGRLRDRAVHLADLAGDHLDRHPRRRLRHGDALGREFLVARRGHLVARRQVHPQLEAAHAPVFLLRHLRMHQAAAGGHPLHAARGQQTLVAVVVLVPHAPVEHVGDGLEATVRMAGEAPDVVLGPVGAELVEQQERIQFGQRTAADDAGQLDPIAVGGGVAANGTQDARGGDGGGSGHGGRSPDELPTVGAAATAANRDRRNPSFHRLRRLVPFSHREKVSRRGG
ncbi:hypothetical protein NB689_002305 [Xanthomonas sacchari]|nr:hypothetical protein [Xanthomonas sacchari]